jgi:uncharacterized protein involved in outer membrane biogenesis
VLVAVLTTALVGPYFIDWSQHRAAVEQQLSAAIGRPVVVNGSIKAALLPTPYLKLVDVSVGGADGAQLSCQEAKLELSLAPLIRGEIRFTDAVFERPRIELKRGADGTLAAPFLDVKVAPESVGLDTVALHDASVVIAGAAGAPPLTIDGLDVEAQADSLRGPFQGKGRASGPGGRPATFHFASGVMKGDALPIKFAADLGAGGPRAEFDGALHLGAADVSYSGGVVFSGSLAGDGAPTPWRIAGDLAANFETAKLQKVEARLGEEPRSLALQGTAEAHFGAAPRLSVTLAGKELNADSLLRLKDEEQAPPERAYEKLAAFFAGAGLERGPPLPVTLKIDAPGIILGGDTLSDVALDASAAPGAPVTLSLQALAPGQTRLAASGDVELGPGGHFKGALDARAGDLDRLRDWLAQGDDDLRRRLAAIGAALPYRDAALAADVDLSAASFVARDMTLGLARSTLKGDLIFTRAVGDDRNRLYLDLRTDSLDLDALPNFAAGGDFLRNIDLSLALNAGAFKIERLGEGVVESGSLNVKLAKNGDEVTLDRLSIADLGGATIDANGALKPSERWLDVTVDAERLRDFALLLRRVAPGGLAQALLDRAGALSPAKLTFNARASGAADGLFAPDTLSIRGVAGATRITAKIERSAGAGKLLTTASLDAPETSTLLRQLGLQAPPATGLGRGSVTLRAEGDWSQGFDGEANAALAGSDLTWRGRALRDDATATGAMTLKSANVLPLMAAFGVVASQARANAGADLAADMSWGGGQLRLARLKGNLAGSNLSGDLVYQTAGPPADVAATPSAAPADPPAQLQGALTIDRLSLGALASLALGPPQAVKAGQIWSDGPFAPVLANPPPTDVTLSIASLDLTNDLPAHNANLRLKIAPGAVTLDDVALRAAGGSISGHATLRRDGATAALAGQIAFDSIALESAGLNAKLSGALDVAATGQNAAALVSGLAGGGRLHVADVELSRLDPDALTRVVAAAQAEGFDVENVDLNHLLATEMDRKPMKIGDQSAQAAISAGVLRAGPFDATHPGGEAKVQASFDLRSFGLDLRAAIGEKDAPKKFWSGPPPAVAVALKGRLGALSREIDSASLGNGLEAQAIARESERIAEFEADIRERAAFNRKLKAFRFLRQRELELQAYAADEARLQSEAERRRVEDELLKASADARRAEEARKAEEDRKAEEEARKLLAAPPLPSPAPPLAPNPIAAPTDIAPTALQPPRPAPQRTLDPTGIY